MSKDLRELITKAENAYKQTSDEGKNTVMKRYDDYKSNKSDNGLTTEELSRVEWTKYKIVVPTEMDKKALEEAFEHIHYADIDTGFIAVNQLAHEYLNESREPGTRNNIIVDNELFESIANKWG